MALNRKVSSLQDILTEMPKSMRLFSGSLRALYGKEVEIYGSAAQDYRKIRDDTKKDVFVYLNTNLPMTTFFVCSIVKYFERYESLSFEQWSEMLLDILQKTRAHKKFAQKMLEAYEKLLVSLKKREDEARVIMREFKDLQRHFLHQEEKLEATAEKKKKWAYGLAIVPGVNLIACPLLALSSKEDKSEAYNKKLVSEKYKKSASTVDETLLPALSSFVNDLSNAAGFFSVMEQELQSFEGKTEISKECRKRLHFATMRKVATNLKPVCESFFKVLPAVLNDFSEIPFNGKDNDYVEKWLEENLSDVDPEWFDFDVIENVLDEYFDDEN